MGTALSKLFDGFTLAKEADGVADTTLTTYRVMYRALVAYLPLECLNDAAAIQPSHLQSWIVSMSALATATRDQRIAKAKAFFSWCHANGFLETNPAAALKRPKKDWQPDPLTVEEVERVLAASKVGPMKVRNYALVCTFLDSGIRNSELCALQIGDLSLKTGQIHIRDGKGGKARTVLVGKQTKEALWRWLMMRPEGAATLFCTERGRPLSRVPLQKLVAKIGRRAGVRVYPHRLRHTFALLYLKNHGDPYTLQYLLGHEDMTVTREYVKIAAQDAVDLYKSPLDSIL